MSELRRKQKAKRQKAIIEAAKSLITEKGYRNTSIEDVAKEAEVGVATVYNYFSTKQELFLYFAFDEIDMLLKSGRKVLNNPPLKAQAALFAINKAYFDTIKRLEKKLLREIFVVPFVALPHVREKMLKLYLKLADQFTEMVKILQQSKQITTGLDSKEIAYMFYSSSAAALMTYLIVDDMVLKDLYKVIKRRIQFLVKELFKKSGEVASNGR